MQLTHLRVANFRAIGSEPLDLEIRPISLFVGENGSGKSSLLEAIALSAQSATEDERRMDLVLHGTKWSRTEKDAIDLVHGRREDATLEVGFTWQLEESDRPPVSAEGRPLFQRDDHSGLAQFGYAWKRTGRRFPVWEHQFSFAGQLVCSIRSEPTPLSASPSDRHVLRLGSSTIEQPVRREWPLLRNYERVLPPENFFLNSFNVLRGNEPPATSAEQSELRAAAAISSAISSFAQRWFRGVELLSTLRGRELVETEPSQFDVASVGEHSEHLIRLLNSLEVRNKAGYEGVVSWASKFGLNSLAAGLRITRLALNFRGEDPLLRLGLDDAATGSVQGLILATQLLLSTVGATLLIEEPENNLHPAWEVLLPELFSDSLRAGHQVLATTHSETLVAALVGAVRKGLLRPEDVAVFESERTQQGVRARELPMTSRGLTEWVESFARVQQLLTQDWVDGLPKE